MPLTDRHEALHSKKATHLKVQKPREAAETQFLMNLRKRIDSWAGGGRCGGVLRSTKRYTDLITTAVAPCRRALFAGEGRLLSPRPVVIPLDRSCTRLFWLKRRQYVASLTVVT